MYSFENSAIVGRNVHGFYLSDSVLDAAGDTAGLNEGPLVFGLPAAAGGANGLQGQARSGTARFGGVQDNLAFYNQSGSMALVIDNTTGLPGRCSVSSNSAATGGSGLLVRLEGTATATVDVGACTFRGNRTAALTAIASNSSSLTVVADAMEVARTDGLGTKALW